MKNHNVADEAQIRDKQFKDKIKSDLELNDIKSVLKTIEGRRFVWSVLESCGIYKSSFTGSSETFFLEGSRNVGLRLLSKLEMADQESLFQMMRENKTRKE